MNTPLTQSKQWQALQDDLGEQSFYQETKDYVYLAIKKHTPLGSYLYLPYGPVARDKSAFNEAITSLRSLAGREGAFFIRIEPQSPDYIKAIKQPFEKTKDLNPKETWRLDLTDDYQAKLPSRLLRYHRNMNKNGLTIETSHDPNDIHYLLDLQKSLAKEKGINTFSEHYLKTELSQPFATLYLVKYQPTPQDKQSVVAAGLVFDDKTTRYNLQGAQSDQGRKLHATGILTIQLIMDAATNKQKIFDFWGIAPEGAPDSHPWAGFTNFKKTFAGYEVDYAGTHDIILNLVRYRLYTILRKIRRLL